jgi:crotonobetaine/carnitine-CoA ligase
MPLLLEAAAGRRGSSVLVRVGDREHSAASLHEAAAARAGALAAAGVGPGDRVAVLSESRMELLELWFALAWLGAAIVPVNTALRGGQLEHVLRDSGAAALALEDAFRERLDHVGAVPERLWSMDALPDDGMPVEAHPAGPGDTAAVLYTSGTTGPAKGVACPHAQWAWWGVRTGGAIGVRAGDRLFTTLPLFHTNALGAVFQALLLDATLVVGGRFSVSRHWERCARSGATVTYLLGAMVSMLLARDEGPYDRSHDVRVALAPGTGADQHAAFRERFGVHLVDAYGSTETNCVIAGGRPGTMGRLVDGFEARVVDDDDVPLPDGTPGELVLRSREPFSFATGYLGRPEQTVAAWRNLWFHTGDRVVRDEDGCFRFVDRLKDVIRRRGENVSSYEVEQVLLAHPDVAAAAAVPVPSELGEDEVLACVVAREGAVVDPRALVEFCAPRIAYFAVPRYVEVMDALPLTANGKVEKFRLRERGRTEATWDREAAGVVLAR